MVAYFSVLKKPDDPDAPPPPKNAPKPLPPPEVDVGPYVRSGGAGRAGRHAGPGRLRPAARASARSQRTHDFPFVRGGPGKERDPARGFLTIRKEVVEAFRGEKLRWGATDFPGAPGDVMHFDDGNRYGDYESTGARTRPPSARPRRRAAAA